MVPADAELTARPAEIPAWDEMPDDLKPVLARQMEIYAGFLEHTDHHVGRLIDALADLEILDDTLIYYIIGDNGASAEGDLTGTFNELLNLNGATAWQTTEFMASRIDDFGTPKAYNHYAVGWAHAMCTPYQWTKQVASHWGGTRNGTVVHWPNGITAKGEVRHQFTHVIDRRPHRAGGRRPAGAESVNGVQQIPYEGVSMRYAFDDADAPGRHETQYFEMFCNRGIYHNGWTAVTRHSIPWDPSSDLPALDDDVWELYATRDWTQAHDLAAEQPERLAELQRLWLIEVRSTTCCRSTTAGSSGSTPRWPGVRSSSAARASALFGGHGPPHRELGAQLKNKSHAVTAQIDVPESGANGVIIAQGGEFGGWSLYLVDGRPRYCYNLFGMHRFHVGSDAAVPPGDHQVRMEFAYDGGGLGKGGDRNAVRRREQVGRGPGRRHRTHVFSADETLDLGGDTAHPVADDYPGPPTFTGRIRLGPARHRRRRPGPPHHSRGPPPRGHDPS